MNTNKQLYIECFGCFMIVAAALLSEWESRNTTTHYMICYWFIQYNQIHYNNKTSVNAQFQAENKDSGKYFGINIENKPTIPVNTDIPTTHALCWSWLFICTGSRRYFPERYSLKLWCLLNAEKIQKLVEINLNSSSNFYLYYSFLSRHIHRDNYQWNQHWLNDIMKCNWK